MKYVNYWEGMVFEIDHIRLRLQRLQLHTCSISGWLHSPFGYSGAQIRTAQRCSFQVLVAHCVLVNIQGLSRWASQRPCVVGAAEGGRWGGQSHDFVISGGVGPSHDLNALKNHIATNFGRGWNHGILEGPPIYNWLR